jgi:hypothetical protein
MRETHSVVVACSDNWARMGLSKRRYDAACDCSCPRDCCQAQAWIQRSQTEGNSRTSSPPVLESQDIDLPGTLWRRGFAHDSSFPRRPGRAIRRVQLRQQIVQIVRHFPVKIKKRLITSVTPGSSRGEINTMPTVVLLDVSASIRETAMDT